MSDTPSRIEIAAQLQAAEARTETRIAQLSNTIESLATRTDHKFDLLISKIETLSDAVAANRLDNKATRKAILEVGISAVVAVAALIVALWVAGINVQSNMIAAFQAGLGERSTHTETTPPSGPAANLPRSPALPGQQSGAPTQTPPAPASR